MLKRHLSSEWRSEEQSGVGEMWREFHTEATAYAKTWKLERLTNGLRISTLTYGVWTGWQGPDHAGPNLTCPLEEGRFSFEPMGIH